ncbi:hypothetical protein [Thalassobellus suaedae]|uniref:Uncharacterized protein n=1 Tax=Thalassobellus suaedae TaxID=3074124 RepID=A0ABY9XVT9_9FLAO|nr:hypothetical protein RHP51_05060 [Flavobacteriaceae bacterium HL-DH14]
MEEEDVNMMWSIDQKAQLGNKITEEERQFFNDNYEKMKELMLDNWNHWNFHSGLI